MTRDAQPATTPGRRRPAPVLVGVRLGWRAPAGDGRLGAGRRRAPVEVENIRVGFALGPEQLVQDRHLDAGLGPAPGRGRAIQRVHGGDRRRRRRDADVVPHAGRGGGQARASGSRRTSARVRATPTSRSGCSITNGRRVGGASQEAVHAAAARGDHAGRDVILTLGRPQGVETIAELPGFQRRPAQGPRLRGRRRDRRRRGSTPRLGSTARPLVRLRRGAGRSSSTPPTARRSRRSTRCAASRWSTGSSGAGTWSSRSGPTGRRCATASSAPILPGLPSGPGAGGVARGARHLRRLDQADHAARARRR